VGWGVGGSLGRTLVHHYHTCSPQTSAPGTLGPTMKPPAVGGGGDAVGVDVRACAGARVRSAICRPGDPKLALDICAARYHVAPTGDCPLFYPPDTPSSCPHAHALLYSARSLFTSIPADMKGRPIWLPPHLSMPLPIHVPVEHQAGPFE
jgi:hypothetical protein